MDRLPAMDTTEKLKLKGQKLYRKKKFNKAAQVFEELARADPKNPRWSHRQGEAHQKAGDSGMAIMAFQRAARLYAEKHFPLKGIALCKMILSLDPGHVQTQEMLLDLHASEQRSPLDSLTAQQKGSVERKMMDTSEMKALPEVKTGGREVKFSPNLVAAASPTVPIGEPELDLEDIAADGDLPPAPAERPQEFDAGDFEIDVQGLEGANEAFDDQEEPTDGFRLLEPLQALDAIQLSSVVEDPRGKIIRQQRTGVYEIPISDPAVEQPPSPTSEADELVDRLPSTPLLDSLDKEMMRGFIEKVEVSEFQEGEEIIRQGTPNDKMYVLVEGEAVVFKGAGQERAQVDRLKEGAFFGEVALITQQDWAATVEAATPCTTLVISREMMGELIHDQPAVLQVMLRFFRQRMVKALTDTHPMFRLFSAEEREWLVHRFQFIEALPGSALLKEGQETDGMYVMISGRGEVLRQGQILRGVSPGDIFGKTSLLAGTPSLNAVNATVKSWLLKLDRRTFRDMVMTNPRVLLLINTMGETGTVSAVPDGAEPPEKLSII